MHVSFPVMPWWFHVITWIVIAWTFAMLLLLNVQRWRKRRG